MDATIIIVIGILALIVIGLLIRFRQNVKIAFQALGVKFQADGTNPQENQFGIRVRDISSKKGGVLLDDSTGKGVDVERIHVEDDILISSSGKNDTDPKG